MAEMMYIETPDLEVNLTCTVNGGANSTVEIEWSGPIALPEPELTEISDGIFTSNLTLTQVTTSLSGTYFCTASYGNSLCTANITSNTNLTITIITITNQTASPFIVDDGVNVRIFFEFSSLPAQTDVQCSGPNGVIDMNTQGGSFSRVDNDTGFLIRVEINITSVSYAQGGVYSCMASTLAGNITATTLLLVRPVVEPQEVLANNGDNVTLMCLVQSSPEPVYFWELLGDDGFSRVGSRSDIIMMDFASGSGGNMMGSDPFLNFEPVLYGDGGVYRCVVDFSGIGQVSSDGILLAGETENNQVSSLSVLYFRVC